MEISVGEPSCVVVSHLTEVRVDYFFTSTPSPETIVQKMIGTLCWWEDRTHCKIQDAICQPEGKDFTYTELTNYHMRGIALLLQYLGQQAYFWVQASRAEPACEV